MVNKGMGGIWIEWDVNFDLVLLFNIVMRVYKIKFVLFYMGDFLGVIC